MNHKAIENKIEELRKECKIEERYWQERLAYIPPAYQGDNNHLLLLLNIYAMFQKMDMDMNDQRRKMKDILGLKVMTLWTLSNNNAKILQRSLVPEYQLCLREKREKATPKVGSHKYELYILATGELLGFPDLKSAIDKGYHYDGQNSNIKVVSVDGVAYRIFLNGVMFEPVDLREWK